MVTNATEISRTLRKRQFANARRMRKELTPAERKFWYAVRDRRFNNLKFRRQYPVDPYIADFACIEHMLIVEIDGGQHAEQVVRDERLDGYLRSKGYKVQRFWNHDVLTNMDGVIDAILAAIESR